jgi:hypothetical protein
VSDRPTPNVRWGNLGVHAEEDVIHFADGSPNAERDGETVPPYRARNLAYPGVSAESSDRLTVLVSGSKSMTP